MILNYESLVFLRVPSSTTGKVYVDTTKLRATTLHKSQIRCAFIVCFFHILLMEIYQKHWIKQLWEQVYMILRKSLKMNKQSFNLYLHASNNVWHLSTCNFFLCNRPWYQLFLSQFTHNLSTHTCHFIHVFNICFQIISKALKHESAHKLLQTHVLKTFLHYHTSFTKPITSQNHTSSTYTHGVINIHVIPAMLGGRGVYVSSSIVDEGTIVNQVHPSVQGWGRIHLCIPRRALYIQMVYQVNSWVHL